MVRTPAAPTPPAREPLSRERIARAALALIDAVGVAGCSMRRLGADLGVEAMALYHHFPAKGALLDAVLDLLAAEIEVPPPESGAPVARLRTALESYFGIARRHPRAFVLLATRRFNSEAAFAKYEQILQAFAEAGLDAKRSAYWFRLLGNYASGSGLADIASRELEPDATPLVLEHSPQRVAHPHVAAAAPHLQAGRLDAAFGYGLDILFDALARELRSGRRGARTSERRRSAVRQGSAPAD
jgi:AcrR family transcriptional regulator